MAISLSEQLESDIKEYLHKTFGTYFSSLDERFAADIKEDVDVTLDRLNGESKEELTDGLYAVLGHDKNYEANNFQ